MRTTFLAFVAAFLMFVGALWLTGCAHQPTTTPVYHGEQVVITVHPWTQATPERVQIVAKTPDPARYVFVGRVKGVAPAGELTDAAKQAEVDLKTKAAKLGADVVKIDLLRPPPDVAPTGKKLVLLAGRAYRRLGE